METPRPLKTVIIDFDIVGFHHYPEAPEEVKFLANDHRHLFRIRAGYAVQGLNREKEIFIQESILTEYLHEAYGYPCVFNAMSCEMIAQDLLTFGQEDGLVWVEVFEDGRGGARVEL